jgi:hypothetical protein
MRSKKNKSIVKTLESLISLLIILYILILYFPPNSEELEICSSEYFNKEHVKIKCESVRALLISNRYVYNLVSPLSRSDELGMTTLTGSIFLNSYAIEKSNMVQSDVLNHELEHINQIEILGYYNYIFTPEWVKEGAADFYRGKPTLEVCSGLNSIGSESIHQFYFDSWAKAYTLLKIDNLEYEDYLLKKFNTPVSIKKEEILNAFCI